MFERIRTHSTQFILTLAFLLGAFFLFHNLHGATYLDEDESRVFALLPSGPLLYILCHPIYFLSNHNLSSPFYFIAFIGLISLYLVWKITSLLFEERIACYAALCYAVYPLHINYSRTLYPAAFVDFFFLLGLFYLLRGLLSATAVSFF